MAIYHLSVKSVSRSTGRSSVAAAAYRAGELLLDKRTGEVHDYTRRDGVIYSEIILPDGGTMDRADLWNMAEAAEKRKDAKVAREFVVALPHELSPEQQKTLIVDYAKALSTRAGWAIDLAIHAPGREGDQRNTHAHLLCSTRRIERDTSGVPCIGSKTRDWDCSSSSTILLASERAEWEQLINQALEREGSKSRVDRRSYAEQGLMLLPQQHVGVHANAMERRGIETERGNHNRDVQQHNAQVIELAQVRRARKEEQVWQGELERFGQLPVEEMAQRLAGLYPQSVMDSVDYSPGVQVVLEKISVTETSLALFDREFDKAESSLAQAEAIEKRWEGQSKVDLWLAKQGLCFHDELLTMADAQKSYPGWWDETIVSYKTLQEQYLKAHDALMKERSIVLPEAIVRFDKELSRYTEAHGVYLAALEQSWQRHVSQLERLPYAEMYKGIDSIQRGGGLSPFNSEYHGRREITALGQERYALSKEQERSNRVGWQVEKQEKALTEWRQAHPVKSFLSQKGLESAEEKQMLRSLERSRLMQERQEKRCEALLYRLEKLERYSERSQALENRWQQERALTLGQRRQEVVRVLERRKVLEPEQHQVLEKQKEQYRGMER